MAANELAIVNQAILNLGDSRLLTSTDGTVANIVESDTPQGVAAIAFYDQARQATLRGYPWPFARKFDQLALESTGDGEVWEQEWDFAYIYPPDAIQILRFITARGANDPFPPRYEVRTLDGEKVIFTDVVEDEAQVEYTEDVSDTERFSAAFDEALSWKMASHLAMPVTSDERKTDWALQRWQAFLSVGEAVEGNESNPHPTHRDECSYTRARFV